ncbi:TonB-dependent receptor domain-containing protein [Pseudochryseolinea flava]|uniref:TonB-dependent receptor n=1 Tax=Pseudochryseolinea flava TaxID=2059302 RepID=A0A364Y993_9BACT|nr:TonB-dependent receptor [Pseudochryseolinea flava]RAW03035.1 TonB-dependent receptor [Pseudochryseolinea flava]
MKKLMFVTAMFVLSISAMAQKGFVRGKVTDGETGEALYGAAVIERGTSNGAVSDFDGNFSVPLDPGMHTLVITFVSYQTQTIENVEVKAGAVTTLDLVLKADVSQLAEVVVTGQAMGDSEAGILTLQKKSANVVDGVSNQTFRNTGDRDLSSAMGRVTGVSVQGGKFVYVRGLGDRYTRTTLNGMTIPGLDPDRNDVQIDVFPTSVLENVIVYKTFSPNLPGDFTGGMVDVETKNFPEEKVTSFSLGLRYNPEMNLQKDFLSYQGGNTDWLGFDDGTRKLPFSENAKIPDESLRRPELETMTRSLNPQLGVDRKRSFLNTVLTFNHGNQINKQNHTIGYSAIFNYQSRYEHFDDVEFGDYTKDDDRSDKNLFAEEIRKGQLSRYSVLWSALLSGSLKFENHTLTASIFRTQNGVSEASERISTNYDRTNAVLYDNILTYSQRSVTNGILSGTHQLGKLRASWKNSFTLARTYDPDFRVTSIEITDEVATLNPGAGAGIGRFWRDLNEMNENLKVDFTLPYGKANKFQFGAAGVYKDRKFDVYNYRIDATTRTGVPVDPNYFLQPENIWTPSEEQGSFLDGNPQEANNYEGTSSVYAGYVMTEMVFGNLKAIYGARLEKADMHYTGEDTQGNTYDKEHTLDELNILPSVNLVYSLSETMNVRGSFGQTVARPSFKEKSAAQIYDPITKRLFNGNLALQQTEISNYDLRLENFFTGGAGDMFAVSLFYKAFNGHIELVTYDVAPGDVKPRNAGDSRVYGTEVEFKKRLGFIAPFLSNIGFGTNVTIARSEVDIKELAINESGFTEFESRQLNARVGETIEDTRPMTGQSPYLINAYLNYSDKNDLMNINLSYNVQGESLSIVGVGANADVYTQPFHSLNCNIYRNFGVNKNHRFTFGVNNILKAERKDFYKSYGGEEAIYSIFRPGRTFSLTYGITF